MILPSHLLIILFTIIGLYLSEFENSFIKIFGGLLLLTIFLFAGYFDLSKEEKEEKKEIKDPFEEKNGETGD